MTAKQMKFKLEMFLMLLMAGRTKDAYDLITQVMNSLEEQVKAEELQNA